MRGSIFICYVMGLFLLLQGNNVIRLTIEQLINSILFLLVWHTWDIEQSTQLYVKDIGQMYGILTATVSTKNQRFQAHFLASTLESLGNPLLFDNPYLLEISDQLQGWITF